MSVGEERDGSSVVRSRVSDACYDDDVGIEFFGRGFNFGYSAWINSKFLGSNQGTNQYSSGGGIDHTNDTWTFNVDDLVDGDNVLTVVLDQTGMCP